MAQALPPQIGRYRVLRLLGVGGMARALLAENEQGARVVLKMPKDRDAEAFSRLQDEARVGVRLDHPALVQTLDLFEHDGLPVLVVSWIDGASLHDLVKGRPLSEGAVARIGSRVASGLAAIHRATDERGTPLDIVHRDVSCGNILIGRDGAPRLIDLGIARSAEALHRTQTGTLLGTLPYLAPELFDESDYGPATDLWALGCVLFEASTGVRLYDGTEAQIVGKLLTMEPSAHPRWKELAPGLADVLRMMLDRDPARRLTDGTHASELLLAVEQRHPEAARSLANRVEGLLGPSDERDPVKREASIVATRRLYFPEDAFSEVARGPGRDQALDRTQPWESKVGLDHVPDPALFEGPAPEFAPLSLSEQLTEPAPGEQLQPGPRIPPAVTLQGAPLQHDGPAPTAWAEHTRAQTAATPPIELARDVGGGFGHPVPVWEAAVGQPGPGANPYPAPHGLDYDRGTPWLGRLALWVVILGLVGVGGGGAFLYWKERQAKGGEASPSFELQRAGYPSCFRGNDGHVFVYRDRSGTEVVKEHIEDVPREHRPRARCVDLYR